MLAAAAQIAAARGLKMKLILENFRKFVNEGDDKVSKKISYLMDKEDKPQDQAVAIALDMKDRGELEEGFKSGEKITHDEYGDGVVTHPGTKNTDVAVKFEKDTGRGKSIKVSRGSLKKAVKEEVNEIFGLFGKKSSVRSPDEDSGIPNPRRAGTNYTYGDIAETWSEMTCSENIPKCEELGLFDPDLTYEELMQIWANEGSPMPSEEELMYGGLVPIKIEDLKENKKMKITKARLQQMIKEEIGRAHV